jgi:transposase-like protein
MSFHRNAKLGLAGRYALVCAVEDGLSLKQAAARFNVSPATAHRWWHRWLEAGDEARRTLSCLFDRSSRPPRSRRPRRGLSRSSSVAALARMTLSSRMSPEHVKRLPVDIPRFPEGSVSWRESVFATFRVADA